MRIYTRVEFMKLPPGTIFAKGKPCYWGEFSVKGETLTGGIGDFFYTDLVDFWNPDDNDSGDHLESFDRMLSTGCSYPLGEMTSRDGYFDDEDLFLVYEPADLQRLAQYVQGALSIATWEYQPAAVIPAWVAGLAHDRAPSASLFVSTVDGITEVRPGEWIEKARGGVRAQVVRATDAA